MPAVGDIIKVTIQQELSSVAASNDLIFEVLNLGDDPANEVGLLALLTAYAAVWSIPVTDANVLSCAVMENLTAFEAKTVIFPAGLVGAIVGDSHPQSQCIRFNTYGVDGPSPTVRRGAFNLMGVAESLSAVGRINDNVPFELLRRWFFEPLILGTGWQLQPVQQYNRGRGVCTFDGVESVLNDNTQAWTAGEWIGSTIRNVTDGSQATVVANTPTQVVGTLAGGATNQWHLNDAYVMTPTKYGYADMNQCVVNPRFLKLRSRTRKLCAIM